jgi:hypothetical protein
MTNFSFMDLLDGGEMKRLFTPCHTCGHSHHCAKEKCRDCECTVCDCDNCRARHQQELVEANKNKRFL